jgi:type IV pilus assembly protein PilA
MPRLTLQLRRVVSSNKGFSLIELLIVVAIMLIVAAIAIPRLLTARMAANESSAAQSLRTMNSAQITYQSTYPTVGYAASITALGPSAVTCTTPSSTNACLIDYVLAQATASSTPKSGYYFNVGATAGGGINNDYTIGGSPAILNVNGTRGFCSNSDGVVRYTTPAGAPVTTNAACAAFTALQ